MEEDRGIRSSHTIEEQIGGQLRQSLYRRTSMEIPTIPIGCMRTIFPPITPQEP
ncbi:MAG: hypothetical protein GX245_05385 [Eubacteriaceae bacterium]|nr:hypothetical protein [Eubacteriaceae bacterium]